MVVDFSQAITGAHPLTDRPQSQTPAAKRTGSGLRFIPSSPRRSEPVFSPRVQNTRRRLWKRYRSAAALVLSLERGPGREARNLRTRAG